MSEGEKPIYIAKLLSNPVAGSALGEDGALLPHRTPLLSGVGIIAVYATGEVAALFFAAKASGDGPAMIARIALSTAGENYRDVDLLWKAGEGPRIRAAGGTEGLQGSFLDLMTG